MIHKHETHKNQSHKNDVQNLSQKMTLKEMINKNETLESQEVRKHTFL